jgi:hypothetical protein
VVLLPESTAPRLEHGRDDHAPGELAACCTRSGCAPSALGGVGCPKAAGWALAHVFTVAVGYFVARVNCDICQFPIGLFQIDFKFQICLNLNHFEFCSNVEFG